MIGETITVNGTRLTVVNSGLNTFSVAIIPYTYEHTNFNTIKINTDIGEIFIKSNQICFELKIVIKTF